MAKREDWFDNDQFWEGMQAILFNGDRWAHTAAEIDHVQKLTGLEAGQAVLDLACGAGRHSLEMARRGCRVTASDRTKAYLDAARERAAADGLSLDYLHADMRDVVRPGAFDVAVCLWASFGYFEDPADDRRVLANLHRSLKPGGTLLMDLNGKEVFARTFTPRSWYEQDGILMLEERQVVDGWSRVNSRWIRIDNRPGPDGRPRPEPARQEYHLSIRLYSAVELTALLCEVGFAHVQVYGSLDGSPYDHAAKRLIISGLKQPAAKATRRTASGHGRKAAAAEDGGGHRLRASHGKGRDIDAVARQRANPVSGARRKAESAGA